MQETSRWPASRLPAMSSRVRWACCCCVVALACVAAAAIEPLPRATTQGDGAGTWSIPKQRSFDCANPADDSLMTLVDVDLIRADKQMPLIGGFSALAGSYAEQRRQAGDQRRLLVIALQVQPRYVVMTFAERDDSGGVFDDLFNDPAKWLAQPGNEITIAADTFVKASKSLMSFKPVISKAANVVEIDANVLLSLPAMVSKAISWALDQWPSISVNVGVLMKRVGGAKERAAMLGAISFVKVRPTKGLRLLTAA